MKRQLLGLDLIRFAAAFMVMAFHLAYWGGAAEGATTHQLIGDIPSHPAAWFGWVGVEVFFVLSGFVIAYSAEQAGPAQFFQSRVVRLVPAAWICASISLVFAFAAGLFTTSEGLVRWVRSALFVPTAPWIDGAYWTLAIEIAFYGLVWGLLRLNRFRNIELLAAGLALVSATYWLVRIVAPGVIPEDSGRLLQLLLIRHGCFFAAGTLMWLGLRGWSPARLALFGLCLAAGCIEIITETQGKAADVAGILNPTLPVAVWVVSVYLIYASARIGTVNERLAAYSGQIRLLGLATYPLYLLHNVTGSAVMSWLWPVLPGPVCLLAGVIVSTALALVVAALFEPALQKLFRAGFAKLQAMALARAQVQSTLPECRSCGERRKDLDAEQVCLSCWMYVW